MAIPVLLSIMYGVHRHYEILSGEINLSRPLDTHLPGEPILVIAMQSWSRVSEQALRAAMALSREICVVHVEEENTPNDFRDRWREYVEGPTQRANLPVPHLVRLRSPYRLVVTPIIDFVKQLAADHHDRRIVVVIPELVERRWFQWLLHSQRAEILKGRLLMEGDHRISVLNIAWYRRSS
jgi:hypothetical protein